MEVNINGDGSNNQFGDGNTQNIDQTFNQGDASLEDLVSATLEAVDAKKRGEMEAEVIRPLMSIADGPPPVNDEEAEALSGRVKVLVGKLSPWFPAIREKLSTFAVGALKSLPPPAGMVVSGLLAVAEEESEKTSDE